MTKYDPLAQFLGHLKGDYWRPTFVELERILGTALPGAARKKSDWWTGGGAHAKAWADAGWRPEDVSLDNERVTFRRSADPTPSAGAARGVGVRGAIGERAGAVKHWADERGEAIGGVVKERPLMVAGVSTGVAFAAGVILGLLIGRPAPTPVVVARKGLPRLVDRFEELTGRASHLTDGARHLLPMIAARWDDLSERAQAELKRLRG